MLTLGDINQKFPRTMDGDLFSDMHKEVFGYRPRHAKFASLEHFEQEWNELTAAHENHLREEADRHSRKWLSEPVTARRPSNGSASLKGLKTWTSSSTTSTSPTATFVGRSSDALFLQASTARVHELLPRPREGSYL